MSKQRLNPWIRNFPKALFGFSLFYFIVSLALSEMARDSKNQALVNCTNIYKDSAFGNRCIDPGHGIGPVLEYFGSFGGSLYNLVFSISGMALGLALWLIVWMVMAFTKKSPPP